MVENTPTTGKDVSKRVALPCLSKTRYAQILDLVGKYVSEEEKLEFAEQFCVIMNYNPCKSTHTPSRSASHRAWINKKAKELGVSTYALLKGEKEHTEFSRKNV